MDTPAVSQEAPKLVPNDKEDSHSEQEPVEPGVVKAHPGGDQRPDVGVNGVVGRANRHDKEDAQQDTVVLKQDELLFQAALDLRGVAGNQPKEKEKGDDGNDCDHPETIMPGKGSADDGPNRNPDDGGNTKAGEYPGNKAGPLVVWRDETSHDQDQGNDCPGNRRRQDPGEEQGNKVGG